MEILPRLGTGRWRVRARSYNGLNCATHDEREQLFRYAGENMKRCVNNNFSFEGFWRQWHATLNKWILRYMCQPPRRLPLVFLSPRNCVQPSSSHVVSAAVQVHPAGRAAHAALEHVDHLHVHRAVARPVVCAAPSRALSPLACHCRWRWLAWAWINCCCFTVEITVKRVFKSQAEQGRERGGWASALKGSRYYRLVEALAAAFNILCLITVSGHHHHRHFCAQLRLPLSLLCSWSLVHHLHHPPVAFLWRVVVRAVTLRRRTVPSCSASAAATTSSTTPS